MCCDGLVCAACGGQVVDAGCGSCRAARSQLHAGAAGDALRDAATLVLALTAVLMLLALLTSS